MGSRRIPYGARPRRSDDCGYIGRCGLRISRGRQPQCRAVCAALAPTHAGNAACGPASIFAGHHPGRSCRRRIARYNQARATRGVLVAMLGGWALLALGIYPNEHLGVDAFALYMVIAVVVVAVWEH